MLGTRSFLLVLVLAIALPRATAQWGVHFTMFQLETVRPFGEITGVLGVAHTLSPRTGWAVDLNLGYGSQNSLLPYTLRTYNETDNTYKTGGITYSVSPRMLVSNYGITYRSYYFFANNDNNFTPYMAPFIGIRRLRYKMDPTVYSRSTSGGSGTDQTYYNGELSWAQQGTFNKIGIPVGLRFGWRGRLAGYVGDLYVGAGYQIGNRETPFAAYLSTKNQLSKVFLQFGYSFGVGWGGN